MPKASGRVIPMWTLWKSMPEKMFLLVFYPGLAPRVTYISLLWSTYFFCRTHVNLIKWTEDNYLYWVLHEIAHGCHYRVLNSKSPIITYAFHHIDTTGLYDEVSYYSGRGKSQVVYLLRPVPMSESILLK